MREMNSRKVIVTMVDGTVFRGFTNIGSARRTSDFFNRKMEGVFMVLFEATRGNSEEKEVYFVNREHIMWIKPGDQINPEQDDVAIAVGGRSELE